MKDIRKNSKFAKCLTAWLKREIRECMTVGRSVEYEGWVQPRIFCTIYGQYLKLVVKNKHFPHFPHVGPKDPWRIKAKDRRGKQNLITAFNFCLIALVKVSFQQRGLVTRLCLQPILIFFCFTCSQSNLY